MKTVLWHEIATFHKALGLLRRFIFPVVVSYFLLRVEIFGPYDIKLGDIGVFSSIAHNFFIYFLVMFWACIYGVLAELVTGRELVMSVASFKDGLRFWPAAAWFWLCPYLLHGLLYLITGKFILRLEQWVIILTPFLSVYVVQYVLRYKFADKFMSLEDLSLLDIVLLGLAVLTGLGLENLGITGGVAGTFGPFITFGWQALCLFILYYVFFALSRKIASNMDKESPFELILINPPFGGIVLGCASLLVKACPMFFVSLRAFTPQGYRIRELNRVLCAGLYARPGALVAISCYTTNAAEAYAIARKFKEAGSKVVMGGPHVGLFPEEALEFCDAVVLGPAEGVWKKIVSDYENGLLGGIYQGSTSEQDLEHLHKYLLQASPNLALDTLMVTRGCKFRCYFCTHSAILNTAPRRVEDMIDLLKHIKTVASTVSFFDSNLFADPEYAKQLLKAMVPLKMKWSSAASLDIAKSDEMVALLKESGCQSLLVGYEIADSSQEADRGGKFSMVKDYLRLSQKLKKAGIAINAHFMFGFPTDNWTSLWRLWRFCFKLFPAQTALSYMSPLPGSLYYDDMVRDGRLLDLNWCNYNGFSMVCEHPNLKPMPLLREWYLGTIFFFFFITTSLWGVYCFVFTVGGCWILFHG